MDAKGQFAATRNGLLVRAPAKLNLSLLVSGKRPDGFHNLETVMAKINWYDEIEIRPNPRPGIELACRGPEWAPPGRENLVYRAARLLLDSCGQQADISIVLNKNIPAGSGLGSASSDAAATLIGLNKHLKLDLETSELMKLAGKLGSDVPFFLDGPLAFCTGKGEKIRKLQQNCDFLALIILPGVSVSTEKVYANYQHDQARYEELKSHINSHILDNRIDLVVKMCANMLEKSCFGLESSLAELKAGIELLGIAPCCLSGSGSAMFCIFENAEENRANHYRDQIRKHFTCSSIIVGSNNW